MRILLAIWLCVVTLAMGFVQSAQAHEVRPAVGDIFTEGGQVVLDLRLSIEPILAGADLEGVDDTNATDQAGEIDALRALAPEVLSARVYAAVTDFVTALEVQTNGTTPLALTLETVATEEVGNIELPRETSLRLVGELPTDTQTISLSWPARYGTLILRQQGVEEPYTGYLSGSSTGPITIAGGDAQGFFCVFDDELLPKDIDVVFGTPSDFNAVGR